LQSAGEQPKGGFAIRWNRPSALVGEVFRGLPGLLFVAFGSDL
jgi:hypothetical protein